MQIILGNIYCKILETSRNAVSCNMRSQAIQRLKRERKGKEFIQARFYDINNFHINYVERL
jgi:predicted secreted protein